jgi:hypothetical protein
MATVKLIALTSFLNHGSIIRSGEEFDALEYTAHEYVMNNLAKYASKAEIEKVADAFSNDDVVPQNPTKRGKKNGK